MTIEQTEASIIGILKQNFPELHVEGFPEKPSEFRLLHPKGAILIHYQGGNYTESKSINFIYQEKKLEFSITIIAKHLRTHTGAYEYLDKTRELLTGFKPENCTKMYPIKEEFIGEDGGIWQYSINFITTTPTLENIEE